MISQLRISRSRSDSRPRPIQVPGRSTKVRSLIDFYNQKALQKSSVVTSKPYNDRNRIPSDRVRSLVKNFSRATSAVSGSIPSSRSGEQVLRDGASSPIALRNGKGSPVAFKGSLGSPVAFRNDTASPITLRSKVKLVAAAAERNTGEAPQNPKYNLQKTSAGLRTVKNWKSSRIQKLGEPIITSEVEEPVARKSTRRKKPSRRASVRNTVNSEDDGLMLSKKIQPLTAPVLRALESEITRSSSLEMEISASPGDVVSDGESAFSQTSESSSKEFRERKEAKATDTGVKTSVTELGANVVGATATANIEMEVKSQQAPSAISKRSGSWKGALKTMRDTFKKRPSTTESSLSKVSDESAPDPKPKVIKSLINNLTPDSPATSYLTAPDYMPDSLGASTQSPISNVQAQVRRLQMLETVDSEPENENILQNDTDTQKRLGKIDVDKVLQEVSGPSPPQPVEDPNTISGMGEMTSWDSTIARQKKRARAYKASSKHKRADRKPVAGVFRPVSPIRRRESPLKPVSPLRVVKTHTTTQEIGETITIVNPMKHEPGVLLTRASMDTLTSFKELPLPGSLGSSIEVQNEETQASTSLGAVGLTLESLSDLTSPPPSRPLQEVRSPTVMREMAFPSLRLRESAGDASMERNDFSDTPATIKPAPGNQGAVERDSVPKKRIFGDADWRMDQRMGRNNNVEINRKLRELEETSPSSYDSQTTSSIYVKQESDFTILPKQNYIFPVPEVGDPGEEFGDMMEAEAPFLKYTINPPLPVGTLLPIYQKNRGFTSQPLAGGPSVIEVEVDGQDEMVTRGRRRKRIGS